MTKVLGIAHQDFETVRKSHNFYVDKTNFMRDWWESNDMVALITHPRRFGKTLNMNMQAGISSLQNGKEALADMM